MSDSHLQLLDAHIELFAQTRDRQLLVKVFHYIVPKGGYPGKFGISQDRFGTCFTGIPNICLYLGREHIEHGTFRQKFADQVRIVVLADQRGIPLGLRVDASKMPERVAFTVEPEYFLDPGMYPFRVPCIHVAQCPHIYPYHGYLKFGVGRIDDLRPAIGTAYDYHMLVLQYIRECILVQETMKKMALYVIGKIDRTFLREFQPDL